MSNFLTEGRTALVEALKADASLEAAVKTWFDFGPGLRRRAEPEPASCPALSVMPAGVNQLFVANVERELPQALRIEVTTDGQDPGPCEELAALVLACVEDCNETCLGLAADGLTGVRVGGVTFAPLPRAGAARPLWRGDVEVELLWRRQP